MIKIKPELEVKTDTPLTTNDSVEFKLESSPVPPHPALKNPSEWIITAVSEDTIRAFNNTTKDVFEGSIKDFNKILRG